MEIICKWCHGTGTNYVERGSSLRYDCPDCGGSGIIRICDECGEHIEGEYCEACFSECKECLSVCRVEDMHDGVCEDCIPLSPIHTDVNSEICKKSAKSEINPEKTALEIVAIELGKAKGKHPVFPHEAAGLSIIAEEFGELAEAINDGECRERQIEESAHVAATAIRFIEGILKNEQN